MPRVQAQVERLRRETHSVSWLVALLVVTYAGSSLTRLPPLLPCHFLALVRMMPMNEPCCRTTLCNAICSTFTTTVNCAAMLLLPPMLIGGGSPHCGALQALCQHGPGSQSQREGGQEGA